MKNAIDLIQILLLGCGVFSFVAWCFVAWAVLQSWKIAAYCFRFFISVLAVAKRVLLIPRGAGAWFSMLAIGFVLFLNRRAINDQIQYAEQMYIRPVYAIADSSFFAVSCYETELKKHTSESEFKTIKDSTYSLAKELGCDPLAIYEVAYSECGMNPFRIRTDGIAAGWIQFTTIGLNGLGYSLSQTKAACVAKDATLIMKLTGMYMRRAAGGRILGTSTDVYCAVFAPGKIDHGEEHPLYQGWDNPQYYLNKGLDGFTIRGEKVTSLSSDKDGVLTKKDLRAALAWKKATLLKKY